MTNEEFLESRRSKDFKDPYSREEEEFWNSKNIIYVAKMSHAYTSAVRNGFPPDLALDRILNDSKDKTI